MKLKPKARADRPNPTAYTLAIGSAEAREAGLIGNKGELYEVEKTVKAGMLMVTRKGREEADSTEQAKLIAYEKSEWDEMIVEATDGTL